MVGSQAFSSPGICAQKSAINKTENKLEKQGKYTKYYYD
jgi:hypothetical protein